MNDILIELHKAEQEAMQRVTGKVGWTYKDLPKMTGEKFALFCEVVGEENLHWITKAEYPKGFRRGQVMISPEGIKRGVEWAKENPSA